MVDLPAELCKRLEGLGPRPRRLVVQALIVDLCTRRPLGARELARLMGDRDPRVLVREHLAPMIESAVLAYTIADMPRHPDQKYTVPPKEQS